MCSSAFLLALVAYALAMTPEESVVLINITLFFWIQIDIVNYFDS